MIVLRSLSDHPNTWLIFVLVSVNFWFSFKLIFNPLYNGWSFKLYPRHLDSILRMPPVLLKFCLSLQSSIYLWPNSIWTVVPITNFQSCLLLLLACDMRLPLVSANAIWGSWWSFPRLSDFAPLGKGFSSVWDKEHLLDWHDAICQCCQQNGISGLWRRVMYPVGEKRTLWTRKLRWDSPS